MFCALNGATATPRRRSHAQIAVAIQLLPAFDEVPPMKSGLRRHYARLRASQIKYGPPTHAVIAPAGTSAGARTTRPSASHDASSTPPRKNAHGMRTRSSAVTRARTRCGTTRPMKPIGPGHRDGDGGQHRTRHVPEAHQAAHVGAARAGPLIAHRHQVPGPRPPDDQDRQQRDDRHEHAPADGSRSHQGCRSATGQSRTTADMPERP